MNELVLFTGNTLPTLIDNAGDTARIRFLEFFTANIRNPNTRRAYAKARNFLAGARSPACRRSQIVQPVHVATYIEQLARENSVPTISARRRRLASQRIANLAQRVVDRGMEQADLKSTLEQLATTAPDRAREYVAWADETVLFVEKVAP
jgi:hypothetical protein